MRLPIAAALALTIPSALQAQSPPAVADLSTATPIAGSWSYAATASGSEAIFKNASAMPQVMITCVRTTRHVLIARPATVAAPYLAVWTTSVSRSVAASFKPLTGRIEVDLAAYDPLLDALAFSRGRIGVGVAGAPALVAPAWPEIARVVEDCRT